MQRIALAAAAAALACAAPAGAQTPRVHDVPPRPALWAEADTNSAGAYLMHGIRSITDKPAEAAAAFYWAERISPGSPQALYGRRVALLMTDPRRLLRYVEGDRAVLRSPEVMAIDSLQLRALALDPFLAQSLDRQFLRAYMLQAVGRDLGRGDERNADVTLTHFIVDSWLRGADASMRARLAYSEGRYPQALAEYERSLRTARPRARARIRMDLGRIHFFTGNLDRAAEHFTRAGADMREREERDLVYLYESKALVEHSLGAVYEKMGKADSAREAYGRALQEDLAFAPAHRRLSALSLEAGDTAAALAEMGLAVELHPADASLRVQSALLLLMAKRAQDGVAELRRAAELEPLFATPHLYLARIHDAAGLDADALEHYRAYLRRAARDDAGLADAQERVAALGGAQGGR